MIQLSNALQNIKRTLYNLKNMCKVQYITNSLQELLKWNHYFKKKIQK